MSSARTRTNLHFTPAGTAHKLVAVVGMLVVGAVAVRAATQPTQPAGDPVLRAELTELLRAGKTQEAVQRAQEALQRRPGNAGVRAEFVDLHLALARDWLGQRNFEAAQTALRAILAVQPNHPQARALLKQIATARQDADAELARVDQLLRFELYESALGPLRTLEALRPDLADEIAGREAAAQLGAADDNYLARNFNEAFALYESVLAENPDAPAAVHSRWAISLALALAESDFSEPMDENAAGRLLARTADVLSKTREPIVGQVIGGLLAERTGKLLEAGQTYARAVGKVWTLPPTDRRQAAVAALRTEAIQAVQTIYGETPTDRRQGFWGIALPDIWKTRQTPHVIVHARNDLIAERVAEAVEFHLAGLAEWLDVDLAPAWDPKLELRVHATREELAGAPGTSDITFAVSHTRVQGDRILLRRLDVFQADPWLLSSTLPHELTHALVMEWARNHALPLVLDEGLALQAEPPARRLMYRRRLSSRTPDPNALLATKTLPADRETFYANAGTFVDWMLHVAEVETLIDTRPAGAAATGTGTERANEAVTDDLGAGVGKSPSATGKAAGADEIRDPAHWLVEHFRGGAPRDWWRLLGFENSGEMQVNWSEWYAAQRDPYRMPLMILAKPPPEHGQDRPPATEPRPGERQPAASPRGGVRGR